MPGPLDPDDLEPEPGFVPPDPDEPPPVELWSAVGDIPPWGTALLLFSWAAVFAAVAFRREIGDPQALFAWGASAPRLGALNTAWISAAVISVATLGGRLPCAKVNA